MWFSFYPERGFSILLVLLWWHLLADCWHHSFLMKLTWMVTLLCVNFIYVWYRPVRTAFLWRWTQSVLSWQPHPPRYSELLLSLLFAGMWVDRVSVMHHCFCFTRWLFLHLCRHVLLYLCADSVLWAQLPPLSKNSHELPAKETLWDGEEISHVSITH